jgi:MFS family permease
MKKWLTARAQQSSVSFAWVICALTTLFYTYEYLLRIEPGIMVNELRTYFALSAGGIGLLASMYYWAYTPLQLVVGVLTDRFGARRVLITAIAACVIGTAFFGLTHSYVIARYARFLVGAGSAFAFVGALKLAADWLPKKYFAFFVGLCTSLGMLGAMFGETTMGYMVDHLGWHSVIIDSVWLGLILIALFLLFVYEQQDLIQPVQQQQKINFSGLKTALKQLASSPTLLKTGLIGCALYLSLSLLAEQWGNVFIQKILNSKAENASYYVDMIFLGWFIGSPFFGFLSEKIASRKNVLVGGCITSFIVFMPIILIPQALSHTQLALLLFLFGFFNSTEINCFAVARDCVDTHLTATSVGFMNACVMLGGMVIQPLFGYLLDFFAANHSSLHNTLHYTLSDYQHALWIVPIFLLIALIMSCMMKETYNER